MLLDILLPIGRLLGLTLAGFALFKIRLLQRHVLGPFVWLFINIVFPFYFVDSLPAQWSAGLEAGWGWMLLFLGAYLVSLGLQVGMARLLVNRTRLFRTEHPGELTVLFAMHNAGYIPVPIIAAIAPPAVSLYMSFYLMGFVILFFTVATWIIQGSGEAAAASEAAASQAPAGRGGSAEPRDGRRPRPRARFSLNAPTVGIAVGILFAVTGLHQRLPGWLTLPFRLSSVIALDGIMVALGAVLASIPAARLRYRREFGGFVLVKMVLYPAAVLAAMLLVPLGAMPPDVASGIRTAFVLQAVVPPATNILVVTKAFGTARQVEYAGSMMMVTYIAAIALIPLFLVASRLVYG